MIRRRSTVRPSTRDDYTRIAEVMDRAFGNRPYEHRLALWNWRYERNPARTDAIPPFLVVEEDGRITGVQGLIPLRIKAGDAELCASCSCDLAVDPTARSAGMKLKLAAMAKELSPLHLSTSANETANKITLALGGKEVPSGRRKYILPLKLSWLMCRRVARRSAAAGFATAANKAIWKPADWILATSRWVKPSRVVKGGEIRDITFFDDRYDGIWKGFAEDKVILSVRDSSYLNWRYSAYPFSGIQSFELVRFGRLLGFAVIHIAVDEEGVRFAAILELVGLRKERNALEHLLAEATRRAAKAGANYATCRAPTPDFDDILRGSGFHEREMSFSQVTYKNNSEVSSGLLEKNENWYLTLGDGDGCYYFPPEGPGM